MSGQGKTRNLWSEEEDKILRSEVDKQASRGQVKDWRSIAAKLPSRNNKDCRKRWIKLDGSVKKGSWSEEEDNSLREAVEKYSTVWTEVSRSVGTRNADQCAKRWLHFLNPNIDHSEWTEEDDQRLLSEVEKHGHNWRKIVDQVLTGRSATDAKNRFTILQRSRRNSGGSSAPERRPRRRRTACSQPSPKNSAAQLEKQEINESSASSCCREDVPPSNTPFELDPMSISDSLDEFLMPQAGSDFTFPAEPFILPHGEVVMPQADWFLASQKDNSASTSLDLIPEFTSHPFEDGLIGSKATVSDTDVLMDLSGGPDSPSGELVNSPETMTTGTTIDTKEDDSDSSEEGHNKRNLHGNSLQAKQPLPQEWLVKDVEGKDSKKSTMVLEHMKPELVKQVLDLLFTSSSTVDVKIFDQK